MGVPKFFRWISARYPCINQVLRPGEVPVIDHFYLDINGILHTCSHPEGSKKSVSEEAILRNVTLYIQFLFNLIKPRKTFFMAVDGVAPRAKMTQQRARRFQSALEGRIAKENSKDRSPDGKHFDPCLISPGTEFMQRLHLHLVAFVENHVNHDADWQCIDVIYSGHDCPGEGEHKIREYMAYRRSSPDYQPNERHCIYGMDADLIFLGLTTHEVNLCILRENVVKAQNSSADNKPFCITYLSVLREYIDLEFIELKTMLPFPYNLERIIDDWVFMAFLLGNDFIPHIPNLHIHAESLLVLWDTYKVVLPKLDGYLVEYGYLNLPRFHKYLEELSQFERDWFEEREAAFHWMRGKQGERMANELENLGQPTQRNQFSQKSAAAVKKNIQNTAKSASVDKSNGLDQLNDLIDLFSPSSNSRYDNVILDEAAELMEEGVVVSLLPPKNKTDYNDDGDDAINKNKKSAKLKKGMKLSNSLINIEIGEDVVNVDKQLNSNDDDDDNEFEEIEDEATDDDEEEEEDVADDDLIEGDTDIDEDLLVYKMHRRDYYLSKLGIQINEDINDNKENSCLMSLIQDYVKMLQWILNYYFLCVADWDFFYAYHYAPFAHDLILFTKKYENMPNFDSIKMDWSNFQVNSQPVLPFIQQLMILPPDSAYIVPKPYRDLMTSSSSPLVEFYPNEFETDINGKMSSWEAVVLIPFVDQDRLINAMKDFNDKLTTEEKERNQHKSHLFYRACPIGRVKSPVELITYDLYRKSVNYSESQFIEFYASLTSQSVAEDFPSLHRLPFTYKIQKIPVHVFEVPSKLDSMALTVKPHQDLLKYNSLGELAENILCRPIRVRWPYCAIVMPVRLMNNNEIWELVDFNADPIIDSSTTLPSTSLRSRQILSSEEVDCQDFSSEGKRELNWINHQLSNLRQHFRKRRAVLFESNSDEKDNASDSDVDSLLSSVLVFSRPLDGWSVLPVCSKSSPEFSLIPNFVRSRANNGDDMELSETPFASAWFHSYNSMDSTGKRSKKQKTLTEKPSMSIECAYGQCDGLNLDLLNLALPGIPPPPALGRVEVDWGYNKPVLLHTIFHPGKIVFSLAEANYGSAGEVVTVDEKKGKVMVRFYPRYSSPRDLTEFRSQLEEWEHDDFLTNVEVAQQLNVPVYIVNRFTGSLMVQVIQDSKDNQTQRVNTTSKSDKTKDNDNCEENEQDKTERNLFSNIGLNLKRNRSGAQVLGWSRFCTVRHTWLFSNRTINLLKDFSEKFPIVWNKVLKSSDASSRNNTCVKLSSNEVDEITEFITNSECRTAPVLPQSGMYLDKEWLDKLKSLYPKSNDNDGDNNNKSNNRKDVCEPFDRIAWSKKSPVLCPPTSLFVSVNSNTRIYPSSFKLTLSDRCYHSSNCSSVFSTFTLLDRVIYIGVGQNIPLGLHGIVIGVACGVSSQNGDQPLEIMFDKPFTDAIDIRGSGPCCALVLPSLLLRLPERGSKKDQPTSNQKKVNKSSGTNTTPHGKPSPPWSTKGPVRVFRPWPVNKFDQNPNDKKKNEHHNRGNQSVNQSGNLSNTPKVNPQQQQSQQQQQQAVKSSTKSISSVEDDVIKEMQELNLILLSGIHSTFTDSPDESCHRSTDSTPSKSKRKHEKHKLSGSQSNSEKNSPFLEMPSPPDVPLPPSNWSKLSSSHSKSMTDLRSTTQTPPIVKDKNSQVKNEKNVRINLPPQSVSSERGSKSYYNYHRPENRFKSSTNSNNSGQKIVSNHSNRKQLPRSYFERPNFNEPNRYPVRPPPPPPPPPLPPNLMQANWQPPPVNHNHPPNMMPPPYTYNPYMYDPFYNQYPAYPPGVSYPQGFVTTPQLNRFPMMPPPVNTPNYPPVINHGNNNQRFYRPPEQQYNDRNKSGVFRPPIRNDLQSQRSVPPQYNHNNNQNRRFIPPQVSRMRRP